MVQEKIFERFERAFEKRKKLFQRTNAVRLVNGKGDGLAGLTVDQYDRHVLVKIFDPIWTTDLKLLRAFFLSRLTPSYLVFKDGSPKKAQTTYEAWTFAQDSSKTVVTENGLKFLVDLNEPFNPGLFLDMRDNRRRLGELSCAKSVLNCFSYTCSFGIYARFYGASQVINVDVSRKILDWAVKNYELNQFIPSQDELIRYNALKYLLGALKRKRKFDLIILDPPSFSRDEDGKIFSVKKDLPEMITLAVKTLNPKGQIFVSTNCSSLSTQDLKLWITASTLKERKKICQWTLLGQDQDFRGSGLTKESHLAAVLVELD